jgi:hypothetical protein
MFRRFPLIAVLLVGPLFSEQPSILHDEEDVRQPGAVRFQGVTEADEVRIDGEVVNAKGLARSNYVLLLAPGQYEIRVTAADAGKICVSRVTVSPEETVTPRCDRQLAQMARR